MPDADIDYSDIPPLDKSFFKRAAVPWPPAKKKGTRSGLKSQFELKPEKSR
jgi:hypothetical protein